jgi:hypothetical protein
MIARAIHKPYRFKATTLAERVRLTDAERWRLKIATIRSIDPAETPQERKNRQRRERHAKAKANRPPSLTASKPWLEEGICRRTWERRRNRPVAKRGPSILTTDYYACANNCDTTAIPSASADGGEVAALKLKPPKGEAAPAALPREARNGSDGTTICATERNQAEKQRKIRRHA